MYVYTLNIYKCMRCVYLYVVGKVHTELTALYYCNITPLYGSVHSLEAFTLKVWSSVSLSQGLGRNCLVSMFSCSKGHMKACGQSQHLPRLLSLARQNFKLCHETS